jgi:xanthine dehydrogenase accessory factor
MIDAEGNGPNRPGAKLAVNSRGERVGTVGGGLSEFSLVKSAEKMLTDISNSAPMTVSMSHKENAQSDASGMICSGTQHFNLSCLRPNDLPLIQAIIAALNTNSGGTLTLAADGISFNSNSDTAPLKTEPTVNPQYADFRTYEETIGRGITVTIIGGGHVSLALTPLLKSLGMRTTVLDNRQDLATMKNNSAADEMKIVSYKNIRQHIPSGNRSFVCIMTFGHKNDQEVLGQLAEYDLGYLGMMGSDHKISSIMHNLRSQGISQDALNRVYAPIGIPLNSNTPEEIAVSIAAQLITVRYETEQTSPCS